MEIYWEREGVWTVWIEDRRSSVKKKTRAECHGQTCRWSWWIFSCFSGHLQLLPPGPAGWDGAFPYSSWLASWLKCSSTSSPSFSFFSSFFPASLKPLIREGARGGSVHLWPPPPHSPAGISILTFVWDLRDSEFCIHICVYSFGIMNLCCVVILHLYFVSR